MIKNLPVLLALILLSACSSKHADLICYNGKVYTLDSAFSITQAFAVAEGKIIATGTDDEIKKYQCDHKIDLQGKSVYPGFIDAHCHFYGYGSDKPKIWLGGTTSFKAVIDTVVKYRDKKYMGWVFGRGWDQNDWDVKKYPDRKMLDSIFPDVPVYLFRIDGHAALVNSVALKLANITADTKVNGGEIILENNQPTGLLIDNAVTLVRSKIPVPANEQNAQSLFNAQQDCFEVGLTTVDDAGLDYEVINLIDSLQKAGPLKMRIYAMVSWSRSNVAYYRKHGKVQTPSLTVRSFKLYGDGALGSRGACLKQPYSDLKDHYGFMLYSGDSLRLAADESAELGFQLNTHCIGDSASAVMLRIYAEHNNEHKDLRWRIEHAQVTDTPDRKYYADFGIVPSMQPTHATSDMEWADERLGADRIKNAYSLKAMLDAAGVIACGSDFPVESINPLYGFYAAVARKDQQGNPPGGFLPGQGLTREQALRGMTIWAAYSNFEEKVKGSIEKGKYADFVILDTDLMTAPESALFKAKVLGTYIGGQKVYGK